MSEEVNSQPVKAKKKKWPWIVGGIVLLFVIIGVSGSNNPNSSSGGKVKQEEESKKEYAVGEVINFNNHQQLVNSVNKNYQSSNPYEKPQDPTNSFVLVNVTITNNGSSDLPVDMFGFKLEDETGAQRNTTFLSGATNLLQSVTLSPGGKVTGNLPFEAKAGSKTLKLHYSGNMFSGGEVIVNL